MLDINNFGKLEFRIGTIEKAEDSPQAIKAAYKLRINFGSFGKKNGQVRKLQKIIL